MTQTYHNVSCCPQNLGQLRHLSTPRGTKKALARGHGSGGSERGPPEHLWLRVSRLVPNILPLHDLEASTQH